MKGARSLVAFLFILGAGAETFGQGRQDAAQRAQDARTRARHYRYEDWRSETKDRQVADEEAARAAALEKSEQTRATVQQQQSATATQPSDSVHLRQRLVLVDSQLKKLEEDKRAAIESGKPASEIAELEARIESLNQEAAGIRASLGIPAQ